MLFVLRKVDDTGTAGLGSAVALDDEHAVVRHIQQHLRVKHGRRADGHPQLAQTVTAAAHHILVQGVHDHRHHGHDLAGHLLDIAVEVADIVAQVQRPAHDGGGEQVDESTQMEHRQHHVVAGQGFLLADLILQLCGDSPQHITCTEQVALAHHNALAQAGGTGGEHQHHQVIVANGVQLRRRLIAAELVHGVQQAAVGGLQLLLVAVILAVGQDGGGLHQLQLVGQLCPALALVHRHQHTACHDCAEGVYHIFVAVLAQQADLFALHIRDGVLQVGDRPADILCQLLKKDGGHGVGLLGIVAEGHALGKFLFHAQRNGIVHSFHKFAHCSFPFCFIPSALYSAQQFARGVAGQRLCTEFHHTDALIHRQGTVHLGDMILHGLLLVLRAVHRSFCPFPSRCTPAQRSIFPQDPPAPRG